MYKMHIVAERLHLSRRCKHVLDCTPDLAQARVFVRMLGVLHVGADGHVDGCLVRLLVVLMLGNLLLYVVLFDLLLDLLMLLLLLRLVHHRPHGVALPFPLGTIVIADRCARCSLALLDTLAVAPQLVWSQNTKLGVIQAASYLLV